MNPDRLALGQDICNIENEVQVCNLLFRTEIAKVTKEQNRTKIIFKAILKSSTLDVNEEFNITDKHHYFWNNSKAFTYLALQNIDVSTIQNQYVAQH